MRLVGFGESEMYLARRQDLDLHFERALRENVVVHGDVHEVHGARRARIITDLRHNEGLGVRSRGT